MSHLSSQLAAELDAAIARRHLDAVAEEIQSNAAECYALIALGDDDYSTLGNTRFGGDPDLPVHVPWPTDPENPERYANFIGQINFAELPPLSLNTGLPSSGILYLFVRQMDGASVPVILDAHYFAGSIDSLARRESPNPDSLCDEYLIDLIPQRIQAVPAVSLASFRKAFRQHVETHTTEIDGEDGNLRLVYVKSDLHRPGQIGQLLGFANAGDERQNLYRQVVLARLGKRELVYNDYWDSLEEYEACIEEWRSNADLVQMYQQMRPGVEWLTSHRETIAEAVSQWRLLLRLNSNSEMNLNINDYDPLYVFVQAADLARRSFSNLAGEVTQG